MGIILYYSKIFLLYINLIKCIISLANSIALILKIDIERTRVCKN